MQLQLSTLVYYKPGGKCQKMKQTFEVKCTLIRMHFSSLYQGVRANGAGIQQYSFVCYSVISYIGPKLWNKLPVSIRTARSVKSFKKLLKTYLFPVD